MFVAQASLNFTSTGKFIIYLHKSNVDTTSYVFQGHLNLAHIPTRMLVWN